jgi:hypothetical protein
MNRLFAIFALALMPVLAGLPIASSARADSHAMAAQKVLQVVTVSVEPGKLGKYSDKVKELSEIMKRHDSGGVLRMWNANFAGTDTGNVLVAIEHPDAASWAASTSKIQADEDWLDIIEDLPKLRSLVSSAMWAEVSPVAAAPTPRGSGGVLVVTGVGVKSGKLDDYLAALGKAGKITERLGSTGKLRVWRATLAGTATGRIAVGVEYSDLATYVAEDAKLNADADWQKVLSGLDDLRTVGGRWMYREITP